MTRHAPAMLQTHARDLAKAFNVRLVESPELSPEEGFSFSRGSRSALVFVAPISDETTYAVALHEIGHQVSATGTVRNTVRDGNQRNLMRVEEEAAWTWARHYALEWTPVMDALACWAEGTYHRAPAARPIVQQAPVAPTRSINWNDWK